jgi:hypothetical protein
MNRRFRAIKGYVKIAMTLGALGMTLSGVAPAQTSSASICKAFTILKSQPYALCAGASSFIFDKVAYAKCVIQSGDSISAPLKYPCSDPKGCNIETVNQEGIESESFIVSTYSPPLPAANVALYNCNTAGSSAQGDSNSQRDKSGSYAQCDGGICFTSTASTPTESKTFPGLGDVGDVGEGEIVCSCPITTTSDSYQVFGPSSCPKTASDYDAICGVGITDNDNGYTPLYIGAPTGIPAQLSVCLTGSNPLTTCKRPASALTQT